MSFNVLVVDDDFINRKLIGAMLKKHPDLVGNITEAENGSEALSAIENDTTINMILLDIVMPILDGKEFLKIFKSNIKNSSIPVIVLSTDDTQRSTVYEYGADDFLLKPINENDLVSSMQKWLQK